MSTKKYLDKDGLSYFWGKVKNKIPTEEVTISTTQPTGNEKLWINPNESVNVYGSYISNTYGSSQAIGYSQEYVNSSNSYSISEVDTGKRWIDNKPIYRKVMSKTLTNDYSESGFDTCFFSGWDSSNINMLITCKILVKMANNQTVTSEGDSSIINTSYHGGNTIYFNWKTGARSNIVGQTGYVIAEYTKTS